MILLYDIITNTRAQWFHCSTIDHLHVTISAQPTLCCHCCAHTRCHIQARASASARTQDAASERARGHNAMSKRTHTHAKSECARGHCQEWAPRHTMSKSAAHNATTNVMWCMIPHNNPPQHLNLTFHMIWEGKVFMIWCYQRSYRTFSFPILQAH